MPKKNTKKKKAYQSFCKTQQKNGLINDTDGRFISEGAAKNNSMKRDYFGGIRH